MKKVLVIHNKYRIFGGEDSNIEDELIFFKKFFTIKYLEFDNSKKFNVFDLIGALIGKNYKANKKLSFIIKEFNPDVAYVHNTWFKANLGIFKVLKKNNIKIILKIHNFRFSCTKNFLNNSHFGFFSELENIISSRKISNLDSSYISSLFNEGINKIAQKVGEEAVETIIEAKDDNTEQFLNESADLLFHLLVLLQAKGFKLNDIERILLNRKNKSS